LSWLPHALGYCAPLSFQAPSPSSSIVDEFKIAFYANNTNKSDTLGYKKKKLKQKLSKFTQNNLKANQAE